MGVIVALKKLKSRDHKITIYTDSSYVVNGITKGWAKGWRKNNWIKSDKKPALNPDLWGELLDLIEPLNINLSENLGAFIIDNLYRDITQV
jgi:ribonuclease HI